MYVKEEVDGLLIDVFFEFANKFGKDAMHAFYLSMSIGSEDVEELKSLLTKELKAEETEENIRFLQCFIRAMDALDEACEHLAEAMNTTREEMRELGLFAGLAAKEIREGKNGK